MSDFVRRAVIGLLFAVALGVRLVNLTAPPLDFHGTRQFRSAIIARDIYFAHVTAIPEWRREIARVNRESAGTLEPPVLETLSAILFRVTRGERLWIPRLFSSLFWLAGGVFLYSLSRRISSADGATAAVAFYLLAPFGVAASRSFQPDPLMVMLLLGALVCIVRDFEDATASRLTAAAVVSAAAMLVKPVAVFPIAAAWVALSLRERGVRRGLLSARTLIFLVSSSAPMLAYYLPHILGARSSNLSLQADVSFVPSLLLRGTFWKSWPSMVDRVVGYEWVVAALFGVLLAPAGRARALLFGLWFGYGVYGLVFTYHVHTHDYYSLSLIPIVALSLGLLVSPFIERARQMPARSRLAAGCLLLAALAINLRSTLPGVSIAQAEREVHQDREIGRQVLHSRHVLMLARHAGNSLRYYGEIAGTAWPSDRPAYALQGRPRPDAVTEFERMAAGGPPEFFVVTNLAELARQEDLAQFLRERFPLFVERDRYVIFDLRTHAARDAGSDTVPFGQPQRP